MGKEIERKFLVCSDRWREQGRPVTYRQGYLSTDPARVVRVRRAGDKAYLTVKGLGSGPTRAEFEYEIPVPDADALLDSVCLRPLIEKERRKVPFGGLVWEVDEFFGDNAGLVLAEVELDSADQEFPRPEWAGKEVTDDERYYNANLIANPYSRWGR